MKANNYDLLEDIPNREHVKTLITSAGELWLNREGRLEIENEFMWSHIELNDEQKKRVEEIIKEPNHPWMKKRHRGRREMEKNLEMWRLEKREEQETKDASDIISSWENLSRRVRDVLLVDIGGGALCGLVLFTLAFGFFDFEKLWSEKGWPDELVPIIALITMATTSLAFFTLRLANVRAARQVLKSTHQKEVHKEEGC